MAPWSLVTTARSQADLPQSGQQNKSLQTSTPTQKGNALEAFSKDIAERYWSPTRL